MSLGGLKAFVKNGDYQRLKYEEKRLELIKGLIREDMRQHDQKRMVWSELGVVGKFSNVKKYEYDYFNLNDYLFDLGVLVIVAVVEENLLSENQLQSLKHLKKQSINTNVRYYPNKLGMKTFNSFEEILCLKQMSLLELVAEWKEKKGKFDLYSMEWERLKIRATRSNAFKEDNRISWEYGTFILEHTEKFKPEDVMKILGKEVFISNCRVDFTKLEEYAAKGYFRKTDIEKYRKLKEVNVKFTLMETYMEEVIKENYDIRLKRLSELSRNHA